MFYYPEYISKVQIIECFSLLKGIQNLIIFGND